MTVDDEIEKAIVKEASAFELRELADRDWVGASQAQFTPIPVGDRLLITPSWFRIKVTIDPDLLRAYIERVSVGLPGEAFVQLGAGGPWPRSVAARRLAAAPQ